MTPSTPLFQRPLDNPTARLLVLGDSQAVGQGTSAPVHSMAGLFAAKYPGVSVETIARSGAMLPEVIRMLDATAEPHYDLILIFAGANDIIRLKPQFRIRRNLQKLLTAAHAKSAHVAISHGGNLGLAPVWPALIGRFYSRRARLTRGTYLKTTPITGTVYIDLYYAKEFTGTTHSDDGLHLNDQGYASSFARIEDILAAHHASVPA